ncbi:MAG: hypothetical protein ABI681_05165 [Gemmatimonadales bacterium]
MPWDNFGWGSWLIVALVLLCPVSMVWMARRGHMTSSKRQRKDGAHVHQDERKNDGGEAPL